jgi:hypothetical protein
MNIFIAILKKIAIWWNFGKKEKNWSYHDLGYYYNLL